MWKASTVESTAVAYVFRWQSPVASDWTLQDYLGWDLDKTAERTSTFVTLGLKWRATQSYQLTQSSVILVGLQFLLLSISSPVFMFTCFFTSQHGPLLLIVNSLHVPLFVSSLHSKQRQCPHIVLCLSEVTTSFFYLFPLQTAPLFEGRLQNMIKPVVFITGSFLVQNKAQTLVLSGVYCVVVSRKKNLLLPSDSSLVTVGHFVSDVLEDGCRCLIARHHLLTCQEHAHTYYGARWPYSQMSHVNKFSDEKGQSGISVWFFSSIKTLNYIHQEYLKLDFNIRAIALRGNCQSQQAEQKRRLFRWK